MKIISIVGARPEFIQSMSISEALRQNHQEILVHTGQHYDYQMSQTFFDELNISAPDYNLEVGSGSHARQTADIMTKLEEVLINEAPDLVIVRGDTNSTIAAALTASKLRIQIAHIEAGERSFERSMPEEINRIVTDRLANFHFCVSKKAVRNLAFEGITDTVHLVGDVMLDAMDKIRPIAREKSNALKRFDAQPGGYSLVTIHRAANTDSPERLHNIANALNDVQERIIFPVHPRTRNALINLDVKFSSNVMLTEPLGYFDMIVLEENARLIATDSGGVQREAYFLGRPCLTLRDETEWEETVETGWNKLVGANHDLILNSWFHFQAPQERPPIFGNGTAGQQIASILEQDAIGSNILKKLVAE